jgi:hypothetical protein
MPIERDRYRTDWDDFADKIKSAANWTCQGCGKLERNGQGVLWFSDITMTSTSNNPNHKFCDPFGWDAVEMNLSDMFLEPELKQYSPLPLLQSF